MTDPSSLNSKKCALITGSTGLLGRQVVAAFTRAGWSTVPTGFSRADPPRTYRLDLNDSEAAAKLLHEKKPDIVIHCAASRFPDIVAANPAAARALNVSTTQALSQHCLSRHIPLLYLSTDYVFPGRPGEAPYRSNSTPSPPNLYGETKRDGELAVLSTLGEMGLGVVLRVPVLYGSIDPAIGNKESAVNTLLDTVWAAQEPGKETTVDDWAVRYPTNTEDVGRVIVDISIKWVEASEEERKGFGDGVLQYSAEEGMTKYRICEILAEILGVGIGRLKKDSDGGGGGGGASRPYDTKLDTGRLKELGIETRAMRFEEWWRRELRAYRK